MTTDAKALATLFDAWFDSLHGSTIKSLPPRELAYQAWKQARDMSRPEQVEDEAVRVLNDTGKRWRVESADGRWEIKPTGHISADDARALCERIAFGLAPVGVDDAAAIILEAMEGLRCADTWDSPEQAARAAAAKIALARPAPRPAGDVVELMRAVRRAEDGAGTLSAKEAVKLRPADWHAVCDAARKISASPAPANPAPASEREGA